MNSKTPITLAQINPQVGAIEANAQLIIDTAHQAYQAHHSQLIVFPEMVLTGYPPEDLLLRPELISRCQQATQLLQNKLPPTTVILGLPIQDQGSLYNSALILQPNQPPLTYYKQCLPNHTVFDEPRYFSAGSNPTTFMLNNTTFAVLICEDLWHPEPAQQALKAGAQCLIVINASPFDQHKVDRRAAILTTQAQQNSCPILYTNTIGGQDELVFDGGSVVVNAAGKIHQQAPYFAPHLLHTTFPLPAEPPTAAPPPNILELVYQALVLGVKDYIGKNGFRDVLLGLSGGIDSALTLAIAHDALGPDCITAVMMPSAFTSELSLQQAQGIATNLGVNYAILPIDGLHQNIATQLQPLLQAPVSGTTDENIQARIRGLLLMALSNQTGSLLLSTGNKSELAIGYATLYGDMAGGFCVLKDIPKTLVYQLAHYRNQQGPCIPTATIERPPSAELAANQTDQDTLPPYDQLDAILYQHIDCDLSEQAIITQGFNPQVVHQIVQRVKRNEYKRRQAPIGIRISERAFGKDRRYPITSHF